MSQYEPSDLVHARAYRPILLMNGLLFELKTAMTIEKNDLS